LNCYLQWARERRDVERDSDFGPEDYFEGALRGGNREDVQMNDFAETMLLISVCIVVSILLYIRTRTVERMRREQRNQGQAGEQQAGNGDRGVFPPPGDPARQNWAMR
jgi:SEL1 protein